MVGGESLQVTCLYVYLCVDMHLFMCAHDHTLMHVISAVAGATKEKRKVKESFAEKVCLIWNLESEEVLAFKVIWRRGKGALESPKTG